MSKFAQKQTAEVPTIWKKQSAKRRSTKRKPKKQATRKSSKHPQIHKN